MLSILTLLLMIPPALLLSFLIVTKGKSSVVSIKGIPDSPGKAIFGLIFYTAWAWVFAYFTYFDFINRHDQWINIVAPYSLGVGFMSISCYWVRWLYKYARTEHAR